MVICKKCGSDVPHGIYMHEKKCSGIPKTDVKTEPVHEIPDQIVEKLVDEKINEKDSIILPSREKKPKKSKIKEPEENIEDEIEEYEPTKSADINPVTLFCILLFAIFFFIVYFFRETIIKIWKGE